MFAIYRNWIKAIFVNKVVAAVRTYVFFRQASIDRCSLNEKVNVSIFVNDLLCDPLTHLCVNVLLTSVPPTLTHS